MQRMRTFLRSIRHRAEDLAKDPDQLERVVRSRWMLGRGLQFKRKSGLSAPLYVTLTSFPARFPTLPLTLMCLLMQSCAADGVILWLAEEDVAKLPASVLALQKYGLVVRTCANLGSYKKIIPALQERPGAFWVTADDDAYYGPHWLADLVRAWNPSSREVICHRAHRVTVDARGNPLPYVAWHQELERESVHPLNFFTGVGGVLYPPGCFSREVLDTHLFQQLCAKCDDVWLWWMLRRNGYWVRKVGGPWPVVNWTGSQASSLYQVNVLDDGNDRAIEKMVEYFGFPPVTAAQTQAA